MPILYLDTSAINHLYDDPKSTQLIDTLKRKAKVYLSVYNIAELASTSDENRRVELINTAKKISNTYHPLAMPGDLLKRSLAAICTGQSKMINSIDKNWEGIWITLSNPRQLDEEGFNEICAWKRKQEEWYHKMHENGRPSMQKVILELPKSKQNELFNSFSRTINYYSKQNELLESFIKKINLSVNLKISIEEIVRRIITHSEHWRFFLAGMVYGLYVRSIRTSRYGKKNNPGSIDTQQSIYIAMCDIIISADDNQYKMMRLLVPFGHKKRYAWNYAQFRNWLFNSI
jgi:hypothetical protein